MTTYSKPDVRHAWAESAANPADVITMTDADVQAGWPLSGTPPSRQRFNFALLWPWNAIRYFMQRGIVDYDAAETYQTNARIIGDDGNTYKSIVDANTGHTPSTSPTYWTRWGYTLAGINASQLTQATQATGDASTKVANTNFVMSAIGVLNASLTAFVTGVQLVLQNNINALAATVAAINGGFAISLAQSGYIKLPTWASGWMVQWGKGFNTGANGTEINQPFPTGFPNSCFIVLVGLDCSGSDFGEMPIANTMGWSTGSFNWYFQRNSDHGGMTVAPVYIAIGH